MEQVDGGTAQEQARLRPSLAAPTAAGPPAVRELRGTGPLLSAPHQVEHIRDGRVKRAEAGTGPMAFAIAHATGTSALCTAEGSRGDPNWDADHPYVDLAAHLSGGQPVLDLHTMRPRGVDICIGMGPRPDLAFDVWEVLAEESIRVGLRLSTNWPFAGGPRTVTGRLQARGIAAVQVELATHCFDPASPAGTAARTALSRAVDRLNRPGRGR